MYSRKAKKTPNELTTNIDWIVFFKNRFSTTEESFFTNSLSVAKPSSILRTQACNFKILTSRSTKHSLHIELVIKMTAACVGAD